MKRSIRVLAIALAIAVVAGGAYWLVRTGTSTGAGDPAGTSYAQIVDVRRGDLSSAITVVGELAAVQTADLAFEHMSGTTKLASLAVAAGAAVQAGQALAAIDPAPYQQAVDQASSDLRSAQEHFADLETPATELEMAVADLAIARAEYQLQQAQDALDELLSPDFAALELAVRKAEAGLAEAKASLSSAQSDSATANQLQKLLDAEASAAAEHTRLASEQYADAYYRDRLAVAFNKLAGATDARIAAETQAELSRLRAEQAVRKAARELADAQEALAEARAGGDALSLASARLAVDDAEVALASAREERSQLELGADAVELAAAKALVDKRQLALQSAEEALAGATLVAPYDGTILQTYAIPGDTVGMNTRILTIANLKKLQVLASVDETTIRSVSAGQRAQITFDALPGRTLTGAVMSVPQVGALQGGITVYEVPVSLDGVENLPLLVGMTANVRISTGEVADALLIPAMALQKSGGMTQVLIPDASDPGGEPQAVPVEVGLSDGAYTQVVRGLNEGDQVVVEVADTESSDFSLRGIGGMGAMRDMGGGGVRPAAPPARN